MTFDFGDVVLVPFPFSDQSTYKRRSAVVVSNRTYNALWDDVILMGITSRIRTPAPLGQLLLTDWKANLLTASCIKPLFATWSQTLVIKSLGQLSERDIESVQVLIPTLLAPQR